MYRIMQIIKYAEIFRYLINLLKKNTSRTILKGFDKNHLKVFLFTRGCKSMHIVHIHEIIFDSLIISNLSQKSAATIGYYYGINYRKITLQTQKNNFLSIMKTPIRSNNQIISLDRNLYINFSSKSNLGHIKYHRMHLFELISTKSIINKFHPTQACYIGILVGMRQALKENKKPKQ
jgi:hypothetical protein